MKTKRSKRKIEKLHEKANRYEGTFNDSYENGVMNTIEWLTGETNISPMAGAKTVVMTKYKG